MADRLVKIADAAERLSVSRSMILSLGRVGQVEIVRIGRAVRVRESDLDRLVLAGTAGGGED